MSFALAFDFGKSSIGVAVGNTSLGTAQPLEALKASDNVCAKEPLIALVKKWQPKFLVVGLPLNMDDTPMEELTDLALNFGKFLEETLELKVYFKDERLTTKDAKALIFKEGGFRALKKGKGRIDCVSAALIMEGFFEEHPEFLTPL